MDYEQQLSKLRVTLEKEKQSKIQTETALHILQSSKAEMSTFYEEFNKLRLEKENHTKKEKQVQIELLTQEKKKIENDFQQRLSAMTANLEEVKKSKFQIETELQLVKSSLAEMRKFNEEQVKKEEENSRKTEKLEEKIRILEEEKKITNSTQQKEFLLQLDKIRSTFDLTLNLIKSEKSGLPLDEDKLRAEITNKIRKEYEELLIEKDKDIGQLEDQLKRSSQASLPDQGIYRVRNRVQAISLKNAEKELQQLREVLHKIMTGDAQNKLTFNQLETLMELFKLDNGRRVFTYILKEYATGVADGDVFLLPTLSFEVLKSLVDLCLEQLDLSNSADYISGKHLLETSSLIGQLKENKEIDFIQSYIKPHKCWKNTFFWEEYFWAQVTTKYGETFSGPATETQEQQFYLKEILEFVKVIWGWGNMSIDSIILFVEGLAAKCGLPLEKQSQLINSVNLHLTKVSTQTAPRTRIITRSNAPRALRDRVKSRVPQHTKVGLQTSPRSRLLQQASNKEIPRTLTSSSNKEHPPRSLTDKTIPENTSPRKGARPSLLRATTTSQVIPQNQEGGEETSPRSWGNSKPRGERNTRMVEVMTAQTAYRMAKFVSVKDDVVSFIDNILGVEAVAKQRNED